MGARPFERLFEEKVKKPLSKEILFGKLTNGGRVNIDVVNDDISVNAIEPVQEILPVIQ
jgi:ATP-dependent Clp protease ATP-binding subunit ClpA